MLGGEGSDSETKIDASWCWLLVGKSQNPKGAISTAFFGPLATSPNQRNPNLLKILRCINLTASLSLSWYLLNQVSRHCPAQLQPNAISRQLQCLEEPHLGHPPASVLMPHQAPQTHMEPMDYNDLHAAGCHQQWQHVSTIGDLEGQFKNHFSLDPVESCSMSPSSPSPLPLPTPKRRKRALKSRHILCLGISILSCQSVPLLSFSLQMEGHPSQKATSPPFSRPHLVKQRLFGGSWSQESPIVKRIVIEICQWLILCMSILSCNQTSQWFWAWFPYKMPKKSVEPSQILWIKHELTSFHKIPRKISPLNVSGRQFANPSF